MKNLADYADAFNTNKIFIKNDQFELISQFSEIKIVPWVFKRGNSLIFKRYPKNIIIYPQFKPVKVEFVDA